MTGILLALIRLDNTVTNRIKSLGHPVEYMRQWNKEHTNRVRWLMDRLGHEPWKRPREDVEKIGRAYFLGGINYQPKNTPPPQPERQ